MNPVIQTNCLRVSFAILMLLMLAVTGTPDVHAGGAVPAAEKHGLEFLRFYCVDCHDPPRPKGGLDLSIYDSVDRLVADALDWEGHLQRVRDGEMPPDDEDVPLPSVDERRDFEKWIVGTLREAACSDGISPGPPMVRRLNRSEYSASVRHLLDIHFDAGEALPADGAGGEGFDNAAETLFISPIHAEKYLEAARSAVEYAMADTRSNRHFLVAKPGGDLSEDDAARRVLKHFLPRAFRRPVTADELGEYTGLYDRLKSSGASWSEGMELTLAAVLVSPHFLFIVENEPSGTDPEPLDDYELATRLAYFLWGAPPDDTLMDLAGQGRLHEAEVLEQQVLRMLGDDHSRKVRQFSQNFVEQWLGTRALGREFRPDPSVGRYDSELEGGMKYEPVFFFHEVLTGNRPLTDLIDSDYTYMNRRLARHYRVEGEFREQPKRVEIADSSRRGGLLGMAAVLAVSSHAHRTSPVLRGKWILETLLGEPPPPPPPNVPELDESGDGDQPKTLRQRLEHHRENPGCATCHDRIDPLGFSLENYDVLGRWRDEADGLPVDTRGTLPDGTEFNGPDELKQLLLNRSESIIRHLTRKMMGYALARGLTYEDLCAVDRIVEDLKADGYRSHRMLLGIVKSVPFRYKLRTPLADQTQEGHETATGNTEQ